MSFSENIAKPKIPKHALVIVRPRMYLEDWTDEGGGVYSTEFTHGRVTRMWNQYGVGELTRKTTLSGLAGGEFYHDLENEILYVGAVALPPNRTAEFELHLSQVDFTGPADPLDATSEIVNWRGVLTQEPAVQNGSVDDLFGYSPLYTSSVEINNADGWLNEILHEASFNLAVVRAYILANHDLEQGIIADDVKATLLGYVGNSISMQNQQLTLPVTDFWRFLDLPAAPQYRFRTTDFTGYNVQPDACEVYNEWYVRKIRGKLDGFIPVNIDYYASDVAAVDNNRVWITHEHETSLDEATYTYTVNHLAANTDTKTFFTTTHKLNIGDTFSQTNNSVTRYGTITAVDRANKWIEHTALTGRTVTAGDTCTRYYIGGLVVVDGDGVPFSLMPGRDFQRFYGNLNGIGDVKGFVMTDNWESTLGFTDNGGIFDPSKHKISCRVYGPKEPEKYSDGTTDVGWATDDGGADASAIGILYHLLTWAGISQDLIDETSFQNVGADSHQLGIAIPEDAAGDPTSFKEEILRVLNSMLWRLAFVQSGNEVKIGLVAMGPFAGSADYTADEQDAKLLSWEANFADIYHWVKGTYNKLERKVNDEADTYAFQSVDRARDLHFMRERGYSTELLQYVQSEAQEAISHLAYALSDRRAFYRVWVEQYFLDKANLGASYDLTRQQMPGFPYVRGTQRTRQTAVAEVQKATPGVTLSLDDQAGIQRNAGSW